MWRKIKFEGATVLIKHSVRNSFHKILVTDFIHLWYEDIEEINLLQRCKEMNKLIEASDADFLNHILSLVENDEDEVVRTFTNSNTNKILNIQTDLEGLKFKMKFILSEADNLKFYEEVTCPLLTTILEQERRHRLLVELVETKDTEIIEYKLEKGEITRKAVETTKFDLEAFSSQQGQAQKLGGTKSLVNADQFSAFTPTVQRLLADISDAPLIEIEKVPDTISKGDSQKRTEKMPIKLKSLNKKSKCQLYTDEDEEIEEEGRSTQCLEDNKDFEQLNSKSFQKSKPKPKTQKLLLNL